MFELCSNYVATMFWMCSSNVAAVFVLHYLTRLYGKKWVQKQDKEGYQIPEKNSLNPSNLKFRNLVKSKIITKNTFSNSLQNSITNPIVHQKLAQMNKDRLQRIQVKAVLNSCYPTKRQMFRLYLNKLSIHPKNIYLDKDKEMRQPNPAESGLVNKILTEDYNNQLYSENAQENQNRAKTGDERINNNNNIRQRRLSQSMTDLSDSYQNRQCNNRNDSEYHLALQKLKILEDYNYRKERLKKAKTQARKWDYGYQKVYFLSFLIFNFAYWSCLTYLRMDEEKERRKEALGSGHGASATVIE